MQKNKNKNNQSLEAKKIETKKVSHEKNADSQKSTRKIAGHATGAGAGTRGAVRTRERENAWEEKFKGEISGGLENFEGKFQRENSKLNLEFQV